MESPLVTVFIPVYNCEEYIDESLQSILQQTYQNLEVLLVDDGSTDASVDKINAYEDNRIRLIKNEENRGIPYTRNVGLKEAKGKYMIIMDSDDISVPDRVEKQVNYLENNEDIAAVGTYYVKFGKRSKRKIKAPFTSPEEIKIMLMFFNPIANPSSAIRKETLDAHHITYNTEFFVAQDYELWTQLSKVGNISIMPEYLLQYRSGHENITKKSKRDKQEKRKQLINSIHEDILDFYGIPLNEEEMAVYNEFFSYNYGAITEISTLVNAIYKLKSWNEEAGVFHHETFLRVLDNCILTAVSNQQLDLNIKTSLYKTLTTTKKMKDIIYLTAKHSYHRLRS